MKSTITLSSIILGITLWVSCGSEPKTTSDESMSAEAMADGFNLLQSSCFSCHNPNPEIEKKIAPTLAEIKSAYAGEAESLKDFSAMLHAFLKAPAAENAIIAGAVEAYGVMPKFGHNEDQVEAMAHYLYFTPLETENWFANSFDAEKEKYTKSDADLSYLELGQKLALSTKSTLGKNLKAALKEYGTEHAIQFCSTKAIPLTDSMSTALDASIKRVSDMPRNPGNAANEEELAYILSAKEQLLAGNEIKPQVAESGGKMVGYYPILTNDMCMQCHGEPEVQIKPESIAALDALYPEDKARGYGPNQLRGIWVVEMSKRD